MHGVKIVDDYRWLEDGTSPETQKWVAEGDAYTRGVLDPLPGRDAIHKRLTELLSIREPHTAADRRKITSTRGATGCRTAVLYVREGVDGKDRVLVGRQSAGGGWNHRAGLVSASEMENIWRTELLQRIGDEHACTFELRRALRCPTR